MPKYDIVIIGSGLGGLLCGNILSKEGYNVCIIEKNRQIGGCLQTFKRENVIFNTGLNYTEGLDEGQILNRYFKYFGVLNKLKLKRLEIDGFDIVTFEGNEYKHAQGHENFKNTLLQNFPNEKNALNKYIDKLKTISDYFPLFNLGKEQPNIIDSKIFNESAYGFINSITSDKKLQNVLAGTNSLYAGVKDKTPLYIHALINYSFINSAWRLIDGSFQLAELLADSITENGGTILKKHEANKFFIENNSIKYIELSNSERIEAKYFISNVHPAKTLQMIDEHQIKKAYRKRIIGLENTIGMFTLYVVFKNDTFKYMNHNHYYYKGDTVWATDYSEKNWPEYFMFYTPATSRSDIYADGAIVITYMKFDELKKWENTTVEKRGSHYLDLKKRKAEDLLDLVEQKFPGIRNKIKSYYTSTPLTYRDFTGTVEGSSYGILKDYNDPFKSIILPKTKIPNLFFTGQNLNLHGILGVTIGSVMTCGELVGLEYLINKITLCQSTML
ncbi:MAG: NAD(P)/FAD-dependent oxidoreductase [Bacteroidales bacterium]|nr:NAD(P)/FAD-dependent oxidoreductase [Bacteroidales bacterium]